MGVWLWVVLIVVCVVVVFVIAFMAAHSTSTKEPTHYEPYSPPKNQISEQTARDIASIPDDDPERLRQALLEATDQK